MKLVRLLATAALLGTAPVLRAATDGSVSFTVTTANTGQSYSPKNIIAIWVTDANGTFVKTLKKMAATRQQYLYKWIADSAQNTTDATTGATLSSYQTHAVTWNCRNTSGALVADGDYRIRVEMTSGNQQGAVTVTNAIQFTKGATAVTNNPANVTFTYNSVTRTVFSAMQLIYTPAHDVAVTSVTAPASVTVGATTNITVAVTNLTGTAESNVGITLTNKTAGTQIGSQTLTTLAANTATNLTFSWNTTGVTPGTVTLLATAIPVTGETSTVNNTNQTTMVINAIPHDVAVTTVTAPSSIYVGNTTNVTVAVSNLTVTAESNVSITLTNKTAGTQIGSQTLTTLAANTATNLTFSWNTTGVTPGTVTLLATANPVSGETSTSNNTNQTNVSVLAIPHDIAVSSVTAPASVTVGNTASISVGVTNLTITSESSVVVVLTNKTTGAQIGTKTLTSLPANTSTNLTYSWDTTGASTGTVTLAATAKPVTGETSTSDNTRETTTSLTAPVVTPHDIAVSSITAPASVYVGNSASITVAVTNLTVTTESNVIVAVTNSTTGAQIGTKTLTSLPANTSTNLTYSWDTTGASTGTVTLAATAGPVASETFTGDNTRTTTMSVLAIPHDLAVSSVTAPASVYVGSSASITVAVTNLTITAESSVVVVLTNKTTGAQIGTKTLTSLPANTSTNLTYSWDTTGASTGTVTLAATAKPVTGETSTANNTRETTMSVLAIPHDIAVTSITAPASAYVNNPVSVEVTVSNLTITAESSVVVVLTNKTTGAQIGTKTLTSLPANTATNLTYTWDTTGASTGAVTLAVTAKPVTGETSTADNTRETATELGAAVHDVGINAFTAPPLIVAGASSNLTVEVVNRGTGAESFSVTLEDLTDAITVGTQTVSALAAGGTATKTFSWNTTGRTRGYHTLRATAGPVTGDTNTVDNVSTAQVAVAAGSTNRTVVAASGAWTYNDQGLDLHKSNWKVSTYFDGWWAQGNGPLGYGGAGLNTTLAYGADAANKRPCYYFRKVIVLDVIPLSAELQIMRDDGVIVYLNGQEVVRDNMPAGDPAYGTLAVADITGANETAYSTFPVPTDRFVIGENVLAVEVHQQSAASPDLRFDLALNLVAPLFPETHDVAVTQVAAPGSVLAGDLVEVPVRVSNAGNRTESFQVALADTTAGGPIGTATVSNLLPGRTTTVHITWRTLGAAVGGHVLTATINPVAGETSTADNTASATAQVTTSGWTTVGSKATASVGGFCAAVAISGARAYIAEGATLTVADLTTPASPVRLGSVLLDGRIEDLAVLGSYVIAACGRSGVQIVNATTPEHPVFVKTFDTSGHAWRLALSGPTLYVADGAGGLRIFDLTDPEHPALAGGYRTEGVARSVAAGGSTVYLLDERNGLIILNASSPAAPSVVGQYKGVATGTDLAVSGGTVFVADGLARLTVLNAGTPSAPTLAGELLLAGPASRLILSGSGTTAFVAIGGGGVQTVDVSTPTAPASLSVYATGGEASGLAVGGALLYVANGFNGVEIAQATATPSHAGTYRQNARARQSAVDGTLAYVAAGAEGVQVYSLESPSAPALVSAYPAASNACDVAVANSRLYVADGIFGLAVADLAFPAPPEHRGRFTSSTLGNVFAVGAQGTRAVVTDGRAVVLVDAADPSALVESARVTLPATGFAYDLAFKSNLVAVAAGRSGLVLLTAGPGTLAAAATVPTTDIATGVAIEGTNVYVAVQNAGWMIVNASSPGSPVVTATHTGQGHVSAIAVQSNLVAVARNAPAVTQLEASNLLTPVPVNALPSLAAAMGITVSGAFTMTSMDDAGAALLVVPPDDLDQDGMSDEAERQIVDDKKNDGIQSILDVNPNDDYDGDGLSNGAESFAGTSPADRTSVFAIADVAGSPEPGKFTVRWYSKPGRTYTLYHSHDLAKGFTVVASSIAATPPINSYEVPEDGTETFFMISVEK